ncbi:NACHT domain protein [Stemphylium lycopersici]|uniref:NACHT domain protein n=1 Tax=Stemphylium lycopersici TaxID=183478 RepID=A0A364N8G0_STELY|nr:NACHT domain protein [Stemphylium lycopersici]
MCNQIWDSNHSPYSFVTQAMQILDSGSFIGNVQKSRFKQKLSEIAALFEVNTETLNTLISQETYAGMKEINDDQWNIERNRTVCRGEVEALEQQENEQDILGSFNVNSNNENANELPNWTTSSLTQARPQSFDPEAAGLGKFYAYVACYWTEHLKLCLPEALPDCEDVCKLARCGFLTLRNWFETYKRPNLTSATQLDLGVNDYDKLVVAVRFGSHAFLVKFLDREFDAGNIREASPMEALECLMRRGVLVAVKDYTSGQVPGGEIQKRRTLVRHHSHLEKARL